MVIWFLLYFCLLGFWYWLLCDWIFAILEKVVIYTFLLLFFRNYFRVYFSIINAIILCRWILLILLFRIRYFDILCGWIFQFIEIFDRVLISILLFLLRYILMLIPIQSTLGPNTLLPQHSHNITLIILIGWRYINILHFLLKM